jgi:aminoglycoside phosphotransferase
VPVDIIELTRDVVARYGGPVADIVPIIGNGSVNQVFVATTERGKLVARLNDDRGFDEFQKEAWCIAQAAARGVLGPAVTGLGQQDGYSYMVQAFLEGASGSEAAIDRAETWRALGRYARIIHSIQDYGFGLTLADIHDPDFQLRWTRHVEYNIASLVPGDELIELGAITREESGAIKELFQQLLHRTFTFGLNHGDLSLKNVIVGARGEVSLLDWGSAEAHVVPHHDIGEILKSSLQRHAVEFDAFLDGYGLSQERYAAMEHDVYALMLLRAIDKLRWAIDWHPADIPSMIDTVKRISRLTFDGPPRDAL